MKHRNNTGRLGRQPLRMPLIALFGFLAIHLWLHSRLSSSHNNADSIELPAKVLQPNQQRLSVVQKRVATSSPPTLQETNKNRALAGNEPKQPTTKGEQRSEAALAPTATPQTSVPTNPPQPQPGAGIRPTQPPQSSPWEKHQHLKSYHEEQTINPGNLSSVDYMACCGLGHRLSKLAEASFVARRLGFGLRSYWGYCDKKEMYHHLFGPQSPSELGLQLYPQTPPTHTNHYVRINNEVKGMVKLKRSDPSRNSTSCPDYCVAEKFQADVEFYQNHRHRFRLRDRVEEFIRTRHFADSTTIGLHIRAGNGETGDFQDRGRAIADEQAWLETMVALILQQDWPRPWKLFVATDTGSMIQSLEKMFKPHSIEVLSIRQIRPKSGVPFGERGKSLKLGFECWKSWETTVLDMMVLSHTDVVVAARPSSFTQSLPMSLVLNRTAAERPRVPAPFCEVNIPATEMRCYSTVMDWCCHGETQFGMGTTIRQKYEYIRMPQPNLNFSELYPIQPREGKCIPLPEGWKQECLPYDFSKQKIRSVRAPPTG